MPCNTLGKCCTTFTCERLQYVQPGHAKLRTARALRCAIVGLESISSLWVRLASSSLCVGCKGVGERRRVEEARVLCRALSCHSCRCGRGSERSCPWFFCYLMRAGCGALALDFISVRGICGVEISVEDDVLGAAVECSESRLENI